MFSEADVVRARPVEPFDREADFTRVSAAGARGGRPERSLPLFATTVVILSTVLLAAPQGTVLESTVAVVGSVKKLLARGGEKASGGDAVGQGGVRIDANRSDVRNVQIINNGGHVSVSR